MKRKGDDPWRLEFVSRPQTQLIAQRVRNPEADIRGVMKAPHEIAQVVGVAETFILTDKKTRVRIENRVYTTYLGDMRTRARCNLPLNEIQRLVTNLPNTRVEGRGQMLIFTYREPFLITHVVTEKGVILENGARNGSGGTAVIARFVDTLRKVGFEHIGILKRDCVNVQGIVSYPFQIALHYFAGMHKAHARYNESPRSVFFYCRENIPGIDPEMHNRCVFEIYQNGTVKCMGARDITTIAACFEYLTGEVVKFKLDESMQKLEDHFRHEYDKEQADPSRRRAKRRTAKFRSGLSGENAVIPYMPPPILRMAPDAAPSLLAELAVENESAKPVSSGNITERVKSTKSKAPTRRRVDAVKAPPSKKATRKPPPVVKDEISPEEAFLSITMSGMKAWSGMELL